VIDRLRFNLVCSALEEGRSQLLCENLISMDLWVPAGRAWVDTQPPVTYCFQGAASKDIDRPEQLTS